MTSTVTPDWTTVPLSSLVEHILNTHHTYLKHVLPRLAADVACAPEVAPVLLALKEELDAHLLKEEMILFPFIRTMEAGGPGPAHCGSVRNPIRVMMAEHESAADALVELRRLTNHYQAPAGSPRAALYAEVETLDRDLREHIRLEDGILFPRAIAAEPQPNNREA